MKRDTGTTETTVIEDLQKNIFKEKEEQGVKPKDHHSFQDYLKELRTGGYNFLIIYQNWQCTFDDNYTYWFAKPVNLKKKKILLKKYLSLNKQSMVDQFLITK